MNSEFVHGPLYVSVLVIFCLSHASKKGLESDCWYSFSCSKCNF